jgi:hypothetical protein
MVDPKPRRRAYRRLFAVGAAFVLALVAGTAVAATIQPGQNAPIVGGQSGRCLAVPNSSTSNGTQAQLWDCTGAANQTWTYTSSKQLMVYGNKCLDANGRGTANGTAVIIWDCNGQPNQQWNVNANGTITGQQSGRCLDANGAGTANGTKIILWSCNGQANQRWTLRS